MMAPRIVAGLALLGLIQAAAACRLDSAYPDDPSRDAGYDAAAATAPDAAARSRCAVVATSEFRADGSVSVIDVAGFDVLVDVTAIHSDAVVRVQGDRVFVVNRQGGDSIQELDPSQGWRTLYQRSVGAGANPVGMTLLEDDTAWVPLYNEGTLARVDTLAADDQPFVVGDPVPVPHLQEHDGRAETLGVFEYAGTLYVIVQGLDEYPSCSEGATGWIHALAPDTLAPVSAFGEASRLPLTWCNPTAWSLGPDGRLAVGSSGAFRVTGGGHADGGVEIIDLGAGSAEGVLIDEGDLNDRDVVAVAHAGEVLWVAVADDAFRAEVVPVTPNGVVGASVWSSDTGGIFDLKVDGDLLWIVDRSTDGAGLVVLDASSGEHVAGPIDTGFPPFHLDFVSVDGDCLAP